MSEKLLTLASSAKKMKIIRVDLVCYYELKIFFTAFLN